MFSAPETKAYLVNGFKRLLDANQVSNVCTKHFSESLKVCQVIGQTFPQLTSDGAKLSGGVKYYYNICFCFYKAAKLYKASTLFLFFVSHSAE